VRLCQVARGEDPESLTAHRIVWESPVQKRELNPVWNVVVLSVDKVRHDVCRRRISSHKHEEATVNRLGRGRPLVDKVRQF
jgi:hypothetical protein